MKKRTSGGIHKSVPPSTDWPCHPLKRVNYFAGQLLAADDFRAEQDYFLEKHRRHNLLCHGSGVVQGLEVSATSENGDWSVMVSPGFAIDCLGNEIQLCAEVRLKLVAASTSVYVMVRFKEWPTDPVPAPVEPAMNPPDAVRYSLIEEGSDLSLGMDVVPPALALARLVRRGKAWRLDKTFRAPRVR